MNSLLLLGLYVIQTINAFIQNSSDSVLPVQLEFKKSPIYPVQYVIGRQ